jgi:DNA-binding transcriptional ArsR family regulator
MNEISFALPEPSVVQVAASVDMVRNGLLSLWALTAGDEIQVEAWVTQSAGRLTPEQRHFNHLLFAAFGPALLPETEHPDFGHWLDALAAEPAAALGARLHTAAAAVDDPALRSQAETLLADADAARHRIVAHLRMLWVGMLADEWHRHASFLTQMTRSVNELVFSQPPWQAMSAIAALRTLLQAEPSDTQLLQLSGVRTIKLVWSPHLVAYCNRFGSRDTLWVFRRFEPQLMRRDPLRRAEVLRPLSALADETRLRILELLTEAGELRAQEIIPQLDSSQGNVSRHLKQLVGAGFVRERRAGDANKLYAVDEAGLTRLLYLLRQLLSHENAASASQERRAAMQLNQVRASAPPLLRDLLDEQGRITRWSSKLKDQQAMLEYLVGKFEAERSYNEREVNDLLRHWYLDADFVLVRRSLVDAGLLRRTKDGTRYWRATNGE